MRTENRNLPLAKQSLELVGYFGEIGDGDKRIHLVAGGICDF